MSETTAPALRYDSLIELVRRAQDHGLSVNMNVHQVPPEIALEWVAVGLLDGIEQGAPGNPPTGKLGEGTTQASVFLDTQLKTPIKS